MDDFFKFLEQQGVYERYINNLLDDAKAKRVSVAELIEVIGTTQDEYKLSSSFDWGDSPEKLDFWLRVNYHYLNYLESCQLTK